MKIFLKSLISKYTPLAIKKSMLNIWNEGDDEFWLYCKIVMNGNEDLFRHRFLWSDLSVTISAIRQRFGTTRRILLATDRKDHPIQPGLQVVEIANIVPLAQTSLCVVICAFESDDKLLELISKLATIPDVFYYCPFRYLPTARYFHRNDIARNILRSEFRLKRGKFDLPDFENIIQALEITRTCQGDYVEIGVYKGDSAQVALQYMKAADIQRKAYFFDLFEGFTNDSSKISRDAIWYNSHTDTSMEIVKESLNTFPNASVAKLDIINDELPPTIEKIAVCNLDVDIYEAIKSGLDKVAPRMIKGGVIVLEDQGHTPFLAGALLATTEFLKKGDYNLIPIQMHSGQMFLVKVD